MGEQARLLSPSLAPAMVSRLPAPFIGPRAGRNLALALALSLLLHGLALWLERGAAPTGGSAAPLRAMLPKPAPTVRTAVAEVAAPLAESPPLPEPLERSYGRPPAPFAEQAAEAEPESPPGATTPEEIGLSQVPRPPIDLDGLRQYHAALSRVAGHFHRYPGEAREAGWEGRVTMRLHISAAGVPVGLGLIDDSGFAVLDQAALEMMRLAAGHTPVPESLHGRAFTIDLAVDYRLDDKGR